MKRAAFLLLGLLIPAGVLWADPLPVSQRFQLANGLFSRGMTDLAEVEYRAVLPGLTTAEQRTQVLFRLGECARMGKRNQEAANWFDEAMQSGGGSFALHARLRKGQLLLDSGKAAEAAEVLAPLTKVDSPEHAAAGLYYRAKALKASGQAAAYPAETKALVQRFPQSPYAGYAALELAEWLEAAKAPETEFLPLLKQASQSQAGDAVSARSLYLQGEHFFAKADYARSAALFDQLLGQFPNREEAELARLRTAWSYLYLKDFRKVLPLIQGTEETVRQKDPAGWLYLEANAYRNTGNTTRAKALYQQLEEGHAGSSYAPAASYEYSLLELEGAKAADAEARQQANQRVLGRSALLEAHGNKNPEALWLLVRATEQLGRIGEAKGFLNGLIGADPDPGRRALASYKLAELYQRQGKAAEALAQFKTAADDFADSPEAPVALMAAAQLAASSGDGAQAVQLWGRVAGSYPNHDMADDALYQSGLTLMRGDKKQEAQGVFARLLETESPYRAEALFWWGVMLEGDGDSEGAMGRYRKALEFKPEGVLQARMQYRLGILLQQAGSTDEAAIQLLAAIDNKVQDTISPDPAALGWLVRWYEGEKDHDKVLRVSGVWAEQAQRPGDRQDAWVARGDALVQLQRPTEAETAYVQALNEQASTRSGARAALWLGDRVLSSSGGDLEQAAEYYGQAGTMASTLNMLDLQAGSYMGLGKVAERKKEDGEAARYFMGVAVLFDHAEVSPEALHRAAEAFRRAGKTKEAEKAMKELQERYPDSTWVAQPTQE